MLHPTVSNISMFSIFLLFCMSVREVHRKREKEERERGLEGYLNFFRDDDFVPFYTNTFESKKKLTLASVRYEQKFCSYL